MPDGLRTAALGLGVALGVGLPPALVAQVVDALVDDDVPDLVTVPLAIVVLAGPVAGGWVLGHRSGGHRMLALIVGAIAIGLVSALGAIRREAAGETAAPGTLSFLIVVGALLAFLGASVGARQAARTRR